MAIYRGDGGANEATDLATNQAAIAKEYAEQAANSATEVALYLDEFADIYLGAYSVAPTVDNDGDALQVGALYFDTNDQLLKIWDGDNWLVSAVSEPSSFARNTFSGDGTETEFTLSTTPVNNDSVFVFIDGILTTEYNVTGNTLTFDDAPDAGVDNILAIVASTVSTLAPADNSVSVDKLQDGAVTEDKIGDGQVTEVKLADESVTTSKIEDISVTASKLASNSVTTSKITDSSITTAKIADANVTGAKLENVITATTKGSSTKVPVVTVDAKGRVTTLTETDVFTVPLENATTDSTFSSTADDEAATPEWVRGFGKVKAFVNFNGQNGAIRSAYNVTSVTRNSEGNYTVNFTTAMANANYAVSWSSDANTTRFYSTGGNPFTTTSCRLTTFNSSNAPTDCTYGSVIVFA
jgi:hypothetical protein